MIALLLAFLSTLAVPAGSAGRASLPVDAREIGVAAAHKLHVCYGAAVVENDVVLVRLRFFRDDLEAALRRHTGRPDLVLADDPATEAAFLAYFGERFTVSVAGRRLPASVVASGRDELDREPVWWYAVQFEAPAAVTSFRVRNALLLELFDDQSNIVKFVRFPEKTQKTYSFGAGEEEFDVAF